MVKTRKVLVTGSEGMLGKALMHSLAGHGISAEGVDIKSRANAVDIIDSNAIEQMITKIEPETVIHAAGYTDVDGCELDPDKAYLVNAEGTRNVAQCCEKIGVFLIYISTDFVFDGDKIRPYTEEDMPGPVNIYGKSKLKGEDSIKDVMDNYLIIRTSWLFGSGGKNFVDTIITKSEEGKRLDVVGDQIGSPTYTVDLAEAIVSLQSLVFSLQFKMLNITNSGSCSWYDFAKEILRVKGMEKAPLERISSEELSRPAKRPRMSVLDNSRFKELKGSLLPDWQDALKRYI